MVSSIFAAGCNFYTSGKTPTEYVKNLEEEFVSIFDEANFSKTLNKFVDAQIDSLNPFSSAGNLVANAIIPGGGLIDKLLGGIVSKAVNKFLDSTGLSKYTNKFFGSIKQATHSFTNALFGGESSSSKASSSGSSGSSSGGSLGQAFSKACSSIGSAVKSFVSNVSKAFSGSDSDKA